MQIVKIKVKNWICADGLIEGVAQFNWHPSVNKSLVSSDLGAILLNKHKLSNTKNRRTRFMPHFSEKNLLSATTFPRTNS